MYGKFFGFTEPPFNLTPDPQFFYSSPKHTDAFSLIHYGITQRKGFIVITGEVGTGKTTLCRRLLEVLDPTVKTVLIQNPRLTPVKLLQSINQGFGIGYKSPSKNVLVEELNQFLLGILKAGGNAALLIDEGQTLTVECLEEIRLLSNLETTKEKLLQIVLLGQPELEDKLRLTQLRQLNQRIALRDILLPLDLRETRVYIASRLGVAGYKDKVLFTTKAVEHVHALTGGIPRLINILCDKALQAAFLNETKVIGENLVLQAGRAGAESSRAAEVAQPLDPALQGSRLGPDSSLRSSRPAPQAGEPRRARFRVAPSWVGLAAVLVAGFLGAFFWLGPTLHQVNQALHGMGKAPTPVAFDSDFAGLDRSVPPLTPVSEASPSSGTDQAIASPPPSSPAPGSLGSAPGPQAQSATGPVGAFGGPGPDSFASHPTAAAANQAGSQGVSAPGGQDTRLRAMLALLQQWGLHQSTSYERIQGRNPSSLVLESGLQWTALPIELGVLERLDYPCLLEWEDMPGATSRAVVLTRLGPSEATIFDPPVGVRVVPRGEFLQHVKGEALILWKALPGIAFPLELNKGKDPSVVELQRLLKAQGLFEGAVTGRYDSATRAAVTHLQSEAGLAETGFFGVQSYLALAKRVLGPEVPSLKTRPDPVPGGSSPQAKADGDPQGRTQ